MPVPELQRCASCHNSFAYDRQDDGTCRICGGSWGDIAGPGRPAVGAKVQVRLSPHLLSRLDARAAIDGVSRAESIRRLLDEAL